MSENQIGKIAVDNLTKESVVEGDRFSYNVASNYDINEDKDDKEEKTSINENFSPYSGAKDTCIQNTNPNISYSPSLSYPIRQTSNYLNSSEKLSPSNSPNPENHLLSTSDINKHILLKNENIIQTPINQVIPNENNKTSNNDENNNNNNNNIIDDEKLKKK